MSTAELAEDIRILEQKIDTLCKLQYRQFRILHGLINGQLEQRRENKQLHSGTRRIVFHAYAAESFGNARALTQIQRNTMPAADAESFYDDEDLKRFQRECDRTTLGDNSGN